MMKSKRLLEASALFVALLLFTALLVPDVSFAQRGTIAIPGGAEIHVPAGAQICADTIFANTGSLGTLRLDNASGSCVGTVITPIGLAGISAVWLDGDVLLEWHTASETSSYGFEVQRRDDSDHRWHPVGFVPGAGTTNIERSYRFIDEFQHPRTVAATLRYRLRMIDLDGTYAYSPEVELAPPGAALAFDLLPPYPNPARSMLTVPFLLPEESAVTIAMYDAAGAEVTIVSENRWFTSGAHTVLVSTADLAGGVYVVEILAGTQQRTAMVGVIGRR